MTDMPAQFSSPGAAEPERAKIACQQLTILGDGQHGKSHLLTLAAIHDAKAGRFVVYETASPLLATEALHRAQALADPRDVAKVHLGAGDEQMLFMGGGRIRFTWHGHGDRYSPDTHLFDDVESMATPKATRVIRTVRS